MNVAGAGPAPWPWRAFTVAAIGIVAVSLRWELLAGRSLWFDEGYSLRVVADSLPGLLRRLLREDAHPPGYYVLLWGWRTILGTDLGTARALSAAFGLVSVALAGILAARWFGFATGAAAAALVAVNPFQIAASNELRMYMPLQAAVLCATVALHHAVTSRRATLGSWLGYGGALAAAAYCSYYAALIVPAHLAWLIARRVERAAWARFLVSLGFAGLLYAPWLAGLTALSSRGYWPWRVPLWPGYLPELFAAHSFGGYLFQIVSYQEWGKLSLSAYPAILAPVGLLAAFGAGRLLRRQRDAAFLTLLCWLVPVALVVVISIAVGQVAAYHRHLVFLQPFAAITIAGVFAVPAASPRSWRGHAIPAAAAVVLAAYAIPAVDNLQSNPAYQIYRFDQAAHYVKRVHRAGDAVVFFPAGIEYSFLAYFDPAGPKYMVHVPTRVWSRQAVRAAIDELASVVRTDRVWLVVSKPLPEGAAADLAAALTEAGYREGTFTDFQGVGVAVFARGRASR